MAGITIDGIYTPYNELKHFAENVLKKDKQQWKANLGDIIAQWFSETVYFDIPTSGSTGNSKIIRVHRSDLEKSAHYTLNFLQLSPGMTSLHCLPVNYIGGRMMLLRAIVGGLNCIIVEPSANPLLKIMDKVHFIAITPHQLHTIVNDASSKATLRAIDKVIVGGAQIMTSDIEVMRLWENDVYSTFGMTECLSHIAMAKLKGSSLQTFELISEDFKIYTDPRSCLVIELPYQHERKIITNDVIELIDEQRFTWKGRIDNVINSGGIKLYPEELESQIEHILDAPFFFGSEKDDELGECLVLYIESKDSNYANDSFVQQLNTVLSKYNRHKKICILQILIYTKKVKIYLHTINH
jgi:O-succinylbenzoic acid--CoA ligase